MSYMDPPYALLCEEVLPEIRRSVASHLHGSGLSQEQIAKALGTSQAMVSRYLRSREDVRPSLEGVVAPIARELSVALMAGEDQVASTERLNGLIMKALSEGRLCARHNERHPMVNCKACFDPLSLRSGRSNVLLDLRTALEYLRGNPIPDLFPEVMVNLAQAVDGASSRDDVASFPGRLKLVDGKVGGAEPEFGCSRHLADMLLSPGPEAGSFRAVINLRYDERIDSALREMDLEPVFMDRSRAEGGPGTAVQSPGKDGVLVDRGAFGIEPCLYLFSVNALQAVSIAGEVQRTLDRMMGR